MPRSRETTQEMRAESCARIIAAARRLFAERGYFSCKVTDVARAAGMSTGNVYWYFGSKEDILKAVLAEGFEAQDTLLEEIATLPGSGAEKLCSLITKYIAFYRENIDFVTITLALLGHSGIRMFHELGFDSPQIGARFHRHLTAVLVEAIAENAVADLDPHELAALFFSLLNGLTITCGREWFAQPPTIIESAVHRLLGLADT